MQTASRARSAACVHFSDICAAAKPFSHSQSTVASLFFCVLPMVLILFHMIAQVLAFCAQQRDLSKMPWNAHLRESLGLLTIACLPFEHISLHIWRLVCGTVACVCSIQANASKDSIGQMKSKIFAQSMLANTWAKHLRPSQRKLFCLHFLFILTVVLISFCRCILSSCFVVNFLLTCPLAKHIDSVIQRYTRDARLCGPSYGPISAFRCKNSTNDRKWRHTIL